MQKSFLFLLCIASILSGCATQEPIDYLDPETIDALKDYPNCKPDWLVGNESYYTREYILDDAEKCMRREDDKIAKNLSEELNDKSREMIRKYPECKKDFSPDGTTLLWSNLLTLENYNNGVACVEARKKYLASPKGKAETRKIKKEKERIQKKANKTCTHAAKDFASKRNMGKFDYLFHGELSEDGLYVCVANFSQQTPWGYPKNTMVTLIVNASTGVYQARF